MIHDTVEIVLRNKDNEYHSVWFNVFNTSLSRKWYDALHKILKKEQHLEKNYLWHGWADGDRDGEYICSQINKALNIQDHSIFINNTIEGGQKFNSIFYYLDYVNQLIKSNG